MNELNEKFKCLPFCFDVGCETNIKIKWKFNDKCWVISPTVIIATQTDNDEKNNT